MKKKIFVKQNGYMDCAAASLSSIIKYYGGHISVDKLSMLLNTTKNGTNALSLVNVASEIGLKCTGFKTTIEYLTTINEPFIAHINSNNYYHYVVIYKINMKKNCIVVSDSAIGVYKLTIDEFLEKWNNIIFILKPYKKLPYEKDQNIYRFIWIMLRKEKKLICLLLIFSLLLFVISIITSLVHKYIFDGTYTGIINLLPIIILFMLNPLITYYRSYLIINFQKKFDNNLFTNILSSIINLPYIYYHNHQAGEVISRVNDLYVIKNIITNALVFFGTDIPLLLTTLFLIFHINIKIGFLITLMCLIYYLFQLRYFNKYSRNLLNLQTEKETFNSSLLENIEGFESIKGLGREEEVTKSITKKHNTLINNEKALNSFVTKVYFKQDLLNSLFYSITLFICMYLVSKSLLSLSTFILLYILIQTVIETFKNIIRFIYLHKEGKHILNRNLELSYEQIKPNSLVNINSYNINFKNVHFSYVNSKTILHGINLFIKEGKKVMVLGKSGSGKSTLFKLLKRYYNHNKGDITLGNNNIAECDKNVFDNILYLSQQERIFSGTLYDNITLGQDINQKIVLEICDICKIDKNLDMIIEENGFNLSGGERQRIVLARTIIRPFKILIIDEGLSQINSDLERIILKNLINKYKNKTIIFISHRNCHMDLFDNVLILDEGKITENLFKNKKGEKLCL